MSLCSTSLWRLLHSLHPLSTVHFYDLPTGICSPAISSRSWIASLPLLMEVAQHCHQWAPAQGLTSDITEHFPLVLQNIWWTICSFLRHPPSLLPSLCKVKRGFHSILSPFIAHCWILLAVFQKSCFLLLKLFVLINIWNEENPLNFVIYPQLLCILPLTTLISWSIPFYLTLKPFPTGLKLELLFWCFILLCFILLP